MEIVMLGPAQVAALLGVTTQTLWRWSKKGQGPPCITSVGGDRRYRSDHVQEWIEAHRSGEPVKNA